MTVEFAALSHAIPEAIRLEKDVAEIGTTNAQLVAENLASRSNVAALEFRVIEISNNVAKNDPLNQPVSEFSALLRIVVKGSGSNGWPITQWGLTNLHNVNIPDASELEMLRFMPKTNKDGVIVSSMGGPALLSDNVELTPYNPGENKLEYLMHFHLPLSFSAHMTVVPTAPVTAISDVSVLEIQTALIPSDAEIIKGSAVIFYNYVPKFFVIYPQKSDCNGIFRFYATNAVNLDSRKLFELMKP